MKKAISFIVIAAMCMSMLMLASCGGSEFGAGDDTSEKHMTINAKNASSGDFFMTGTLEVGENEQIVIEPSLEKGAVTIEFVSAEGLDNVEEVPEVEGEAVFSTDVSGTEAQTASFGTGPFMVKATVSEKATGTIEINVKSIDG